MSENSAKRKTIGVAVAITLIAVLAVGIFAVDWNNYVGDSPSELPTFPTDDGDSIWADEENNVLKQDSLAYVIFEKYGLALIPLALLMFGAMVGGVVISREEVESDDSN